MNESNRKMCLHRCERGQIATDEEMEKNSQPVEMPFRLW